MLRVCTAVLLAAASLAQCAAASAPRVRLGGEIADGRPSVRWRGFNLLEMFYRSGKQPPRDFLEEDFALIREWGFNFVRLPMDYRYWIKDGDRRNWEKFDEAGLEPVDRAVALGRKYGVHVCINMHRCPGYSVAKPTEDRDLFSDEEALRVCRAHWAMFARRYRDVPSAALSFNLFNEPPDVAEDAHERVVRSLVEAIRAEDPRRFIVVDGLSWGKKPPLTLCGMRGVGFAGRGYLPMSVTHYKAPWVSGCNAPPVWPLGFDMPEGAMTGPSRPKWRRPLEILDLPPGKMTFRFGKTSGPVAVKFAADGVTLKRTAMEPDGKSPLWENVVDCPQWGLRQGYCLCEETFSFPRPVRKFTAELESGDWVQFGGLEFVSPDGARRATLGANPVWGEPRNFSQKFLGWEAGFKPSVAQAPSRTYSDPGMEYLYRTVFKEWDAAIEKGAFCFAGEFGVWKKTPHAMALALMEDYLRLWKERNMGWALWNLRGSNGVLDSERGDVAYEDFRGRKLDRKMLELLRRY